MKKAHPLTLIILGFACLASVTEAMISIRQHNEASASPVAYLSDDVSVLTALEVARSSYLKACIDANDKGQWTTCVDLAKKHVHGIHEILSQSGESISQNSGHQELETQNEDVDQQMKSPSHKARL